VSFIDDYSKFTLIYLLKKKSDVFQKFRDFQHHVERLFDRKIIAMQTDWGGEYQKLNSFFQRMGISHLVSCPHAHQQNGPAERKHRHIVEVGLSLLAYASMPLKYWDEAFLTAVYLINHLPSKVIQSQTPMERLFGKSGDYSLLRIFGCACWPNLHPYNKHKLEFRSKQYVFLGYSNLHKGYKCLDISTGRLYIFRDIVFDETVFPFASLHSNAGARLRAEINLLPLSLQPFNLHTHGGHELQGPVDANPTDVVAESFLQESDQNSAYNDESSDFLVPGTESGVASSPDQSALQEISSGSALHWDLWRPASPAGVAPSASPMASADSLPGPGGYRGGPPDAGLSAAAMESPGSSASASSATQPTTGSPVSSAAASESASGSLPRSSAPLSSVAVPVPPLDRPRTRLQSGVSQPKKFTDGTIRYAYFCSTGEPSSTTEAFADPRWKAEWTKSMMP
jgi:hypothetical protein